MKILYFGGQKSGKSSLSEKHALTISSKKPFYIATYDNSYEDSEMKTRIKKHQEYRNENFITIEECKDLTKVIKKGETYLIDCISMWIFNNLKEEEEKLLKQLEALENLEANIIFVLNEVTSGVIPFDKDSRRFVDLTGIVGQKLTSICDEVYEVKFALPNRLK